MFIRRLKTSFFIILFLFVLHFVPLWVFLTIVFCIWNMASRELNLLLSNNQYSFLWKVYFWSAYLIILYISLKYNSQKIIFHILGISSAHDIGGYIGGTLFGKHILVKELSPKKTLEGLLVSFIFVFSYVVFLNQIITLNILFKSLFLTLVCLCGDLSISYLKRKKGVKDTGDILDGHGGVLDRLDSVLPLFVLFLFL